MIQIPKDMSRLDWQVMELFDSVKNKKEVAHILRISIRRVQQITKKHKAQ